MRKLCLILFVVISSVCAYAQPDIHFTTNHFALYLNPGDSITITDSLYNTGTPYTGVVGFGAAINDTQTTTHIDTNALYNGLLQDSAGIQPRLLCSFVIHADTITPFVIGTNIVIIWPVYNSGAHGGLPQPIDTVTVTINLAPTGIAEAPLSRMYLYQTEGQVHLMFGSAENIIQQVRIYDIPGQLLYADTPDKSKTINSTGWQPGIYLCELTTYNGERRTLKFRLE